MPVTIIRTLIIYLLVVILVRLMGKRQIGEMQPTELVTTILLSEIAAIPIQDSGIPMINTVAAVVLLGCFEVLQSALSLKSQRFRKICDGSPVQIITNGTIDFEQLKKLRLTSEDVASALRQKDIFNIKDVEYALIETNGAISAKIKENNGSDNNK